MKSVCNRLVDSIRDQRLIHGSTTNRSRKFRCGVPIRFYYSEQLKQQPSRAKDRAWTILSEIQKEDFEDELSKLGRKVFGLDLVGNLATAALRRNEGRQILKSDKIEL